MLLVAGVPLPVSVTDSAAIWAAECPWTSWWGCEMEERVGVAGLEAEEKGPSRAESWFREVAVRSGGDTPA